MSIRKYCLFLYGNIAYFRMLFYNIILFSHFPVISFTNSEIKKRITIGVVVFFVLGKIWCIHKTIVAFDLSQFHTL